MNKRDQFNTIYNQCFNNVFSYFSACFNSQIAEDLSQNVFMKIWKKILETDFTMPQKPMAWVFRIALNIKNDFLRDKYKSTGGDFEIYDKDILTDNSSVVDNGIAIETAFSMLSFKEKEVLLLKSYGFNSKEIGDMIGLSASGARSRISLAESNFKKYLEKCGVKIE